MGGFSIVPLAQKARTKTLIADSDLNLGNYDLIATDVKGDTAEFSEFVGGVGNFDSALIRGNTQIDGNIVLEGAINNVNIADNGEITTSQGVNAANFNGFPIKSSGVITVTPTGNIIRHGYAANDIVLPFYGDVTYTGSLIFNNIGSSTIEVGLDKGVNTGGSITHDYPYDYYYVITLSSGETMTVNFENIPYLCVLSNNHYYGMSGFTFS